MRRSPEMLNEGPQEIAPVQEIADELREQETSLLRETEQIARESEQIAVEHPELRERAEALKRRSELLGRRSKQVLSIVTLFAAMAFSPNLAENAEAQARPENAKEHAELYSKTRYRVTEGLGQGGGVVFHHQDEETTQIIEYISGRADIPHDVKLSAEIKALKDAFEEIQEKVPLNIDHMDQKQLSQTFDRVEKEILIKEGVPSLYADGLLEKRLPLRYERDDDLYLALWKVEEAGGNPAIRMDMDEMGSGGGRSKRAHYDIETNTMHIYYPRTLGLFQQKSVIKSFVAEASHGKQWNEDFDKSEARSSKEIAWIKERVAGETAEGKETTFDQEYDKLEYDTPTTIEYEAHEQIEPELFKAVPHRYRPGSIETDVVAKKRGGVPPAPTEEIVKTVVEKHIGARAEELSLWLAEMGEKDAEIKPGPDGGHRSFWLMHMDEKHPTVRHIALNFKVQTFDRKEFEQKIRASLSAFRKM